jgi:GNAT superfamily N-acetyltransferase
VEVQTLNDNDINLLSGLQPEGWYDIIPNFDFYLKSSFCFPVKVVIDNNITGIGAAIIHNGIAWLGHIIVHIDSRRKGLGQLITQNLIDIAKQKNCDTIYLIATDLGSPVYEKLGFIAETEYLFFKDINIGKELQIPNNIEPYRREFREQISVIDKINSGEERMVELENHLQNGFVYWEDRVIEGFYLPTFGEGLILANTTSAGLGLLKFHLKTNDKVALPKDNLAAITFLYENGFEEFKTAKRMRLGKGRTVKLANIYNRIGGNIG